MSVLHRKVSLGKYMEAEVTEIKPKTLVWTVRNIDHGYVLGTIKWFAQWRQYCFFPSIDVLRQVFVNEFLYADRFYEKNELQTKLKNILDKAEKEGIIIFSGSCMQEIVDFTKTLKLKATPQVKEEC